MTTKFRKFLLVSSETAHLTREDFLLERVAWDEIGSIANLCDYDRIIINLTALAQCLLPKFELSEITAVFNSLSWYHILASGGEILLIGDPEVVIHAVATSEGTGNPHFRPLDGVLAIQKDGRPLDYRRVDQTRRHDFESIYSYLDKARQFTYSISRCTFSNSLRKLLDEGEINFAVNAVGVTNYQTALTLVLHFTGQWGKAGVLYLFPSLGGGADEDDVVVLRDFIGIPTTLPEPVWVSSLSLPGQLEIEAEINEKHETLGRVEEEISDGECRLALCKRWFRLLYDDGDSLERIVKEALEFLGGSVAKTSKEKDDYRLRVAGYPETVMEVKGTHNSRFTIGALRQLAGWIDEVIAQENTQVKGMFVGNAGRNDEPSTRGNLFEKNNENFAKIRDIVILRSMDLYCITILKHLSKIDVNVLWPEIYGSKGAFDATKYWEMLPNQFKLKSAAPQQGHSG